MAKFLKSLVGSAAEKAAARASKLSTQLAETDRAIEAADSRKAAERKALTEALGSGSDTSGPEAALVEIAGTVARLGERRAALADLVEKATAEAVEARRAASLDSAREALAEARTEAEEAQRKAVAAFIEAGKAAGRFAEVARRRDSVAAGLRVLDPETEPDSGPCLALFHFAVARAAEAEGLRPLGTMPATLTLY